MLLARCDNRLCGCTMVGNNKFITVYLVTYFFRGQEGNSCLMKARPQSSDSGYSGMIFYLVVTLDVACCLPCPFVA